MFDIKSWAELSVMGITIVGAIAGCLHYMVRVLIRDEVMTAIRHNEATIASQGEKVTEAVARIEKELDARITRIEDKLDVRMLNVENRLMDAAMVRAQIEILSGRLNRIEEKLDL